jgi:SAM-dependent methyltransferase
MSKVANFNSQSLEELAAYSGNPWGPTNSYFAQAEESIRGQWDGFIFPFIKAADFSSCVDLAAGHGRNSELLLKDAGAESLAVIDFQQGNIEVCKKRLAGYLNVSFYVNNGYDLNPIPDESVTFIYCFDAMVHFDSDVVRSYLKDSFRVLRKGGRAFFHHSNYTGGHDWRMNPGSRNFMSKELFVHYSVKERLLVLEQRLLDWTLPALDCMTLVEKPHVS